MYYLLAFIKENEIYKLMYWLIRIYTQHTQ